MEFCMDLMKRKNVNIMNLIEIEKKLREELNIDFKFTHYYDDTLEITINKGDNTEIVTINRWFENIEDACSRITCNIKYVYNNMIYYKDDGLTTLKFNHYTIIEYTDDIIIAKSEITGEICLIIFNINNIDIRRY